MHCFREDNKPTGARYIAQKVIAGIVKPEWCFLIIALVLGSCFALLVPAGGGADEPNHIARAVSIAHGNMLADKIPDRVGYTSPKDTEGIDSALYGGVVDSALTEVAWHNMVVFHSGKEKGDGQPTYKFPTWTTSGMMSQRNVGESSHVEAFSNAAVNSPFVYLPFVLGYWIARLFTSNAYAIILIMRMFGLIASSIIVFLCIKFIPVGKWILASISLMPTMIIFNSVVTADTLTYAMCVAFIAVVLRCMCKSQLLSRFDWTLLCLTSISLAFVKLSYVPLVLLLILIPICNQYVRGRLNLLALAGICVVVGVFFIGWYLAVSSINTGAMFNVGASPTLQKRYIFSHLTTYMGLLIKQFVGQNFFSLGVAGTLDLHGHYAFTGWITVCVLICSVLLVDSREYSWNILRKSAIWCCLLFLLVSAFVFGLVETALYLQFSAVGANDIAGVQSRYFLPILPLLVLAIVIMTKEVADSGESNVPTERGVVHTVSSNRLGLGMMLTLQTISALFTLYLLFTTLYFV